MAWARKPPTWAIGFLDEVWWSRFALPQEPRREQMWLRFVSGRPVSAITTQFLDWCRKCLLKQGKSNWLLIWLPKPRPWLNPTRPKWVHGKRNVVEHDGLLTAKPLAEGICAYFGCSYEPHLSLPEKVT